MISGKQHEDMLRAIRDSLFEKIQQQPLNVAAEILSAYALVDLALIVRMK